jgi:hypothetical protein
MRGMLSPIFGNNNDSNGSFADECTSVRTFCMDADGLVYLTDCLFSWCLHLRVSVFAAGRGCLLLWPPFATFATPENSLLGGLFGALLGASALAVAARWPLVCCPGAPAFATFVGNVRPVRTREPAPALAGLRLRAGVSCPRRPRPEAGCPGLHWGSRPLRLFSRGARPRR